MLAQTSILLASGKCDTSLHAIRWYRMHVHMAWLARVNKESFNLTQMQQIPPLAMQQADYTEYNSEVQLCRADLSRRASMLLCMLRPATILSSFSRKVLPS